MRSQSIPLPERFDHLLQEQWAQDPEGVLKALMANSLRAEKAAIPSFLSIRFPQTISSEHRRQSESLYRQSGDVFYTDLARVITPYSLPVDRINFLASVWSENRSIIGDYQKWISEIELVVKDYSNCIFVQVEKNGPAYMIAPLEKEGKSYYSVFELGPKPRFIKNFGETAQKNPDRLLIAINGYTIQAYELPEEGMSSVASSKLAGELTLSSEMTKDKAHQLAAEAVLQRGHSEKTYERLIEAAVGVIEHRYDLRGFLESTASLPGILLNPRDLEELFNYVRNIAAFSESLSLTAGQIWKIRDMIWQHYLPKKDLTGLIEEINRNFGRTLDQEQIGIIERWINLESHGSLTKEEKVMINGVEISRYRLMKIMAKLGQLSGPDRFRERKILLTLSRGKMRASTGAAVLVGDGIVDAIGLFNQETNGRSILNWEIAKIVLALVDPQGIATKLWGPDGVQLDKGETVLIPVLDRVMMQGHQQGQELQFLANLTPIGDKTMGDRIGFSYQENRQGTVDAIYLHENYPSTMPQVENKEVLRLTRIGDCVRMENVSKHPLRLAQNKAMKISPSSHPAFNIIAKGPSDALTPGGIDLNTSNGMHWKISKDGRGVDMTVDPAMIARFRRDGIDSLSAVIVRITPVESIWPLMGFQASLQAAAGAGGLRIISKK